MAQIVETIPVMADSFVIFIPATADIFQLSGEPGIPK